ncbi:hypothetical protein P8452_24707 [Trifolium repens]|nr:hypothetical protein P8452_24707 [Trifolium repens]
MDSQTVEGAANDETPESKRVKMTTSDCWKYFTKLDPGADDVPRAKCKGCAKVFRAGGNNGRFQFQPMPTTSTEASYVYNIDDDDD